MASSYCAVKYPMGANSQEVRKHQIPSKHWQDGSCCYLADGQNNVIHKDQAHIGPTFQVALHTDTDDIQRLPRGLVHFETTLRENSNDRLIRILPETQSFDTSTLFWYLQVPVHLRSKKRIIHDA